MALPKISLIMFHDSLVDTITIRPNQRVSVAFASLIVYEEIHREEHIIAQYRALLEVTGATEVETHQELFDHAKNWDNVYDGWIKGPNGKYIEPDSCLEAQTIGQVELKLFGGKLRVMGGTLRIELFERVGEMGVWRESVEPDPISDQPAKTDPPPGHGEPVEGCFLCHRTSNHFFFENDLVLAFMDGLPLPALHVLVAPRRHLLRWSDVTQEERLALLAMVEQVTDHLRSVYGAEGMTLGINDGEAAGQTEPHIYVHIIPRRTGDVPDPRGGVRWVLPVQAALWKDRGG